MRFYKNIHVEQKTAKLDNLRIFLNTFFTGLVINLTTLPKIGKKV